MLTHPTLDTFRQLRLTGMLEALEEQLNTPDMATLAFEERHGKGCGGDNFSWTATIPLWWDREAYQ
jgi:hypothetical protein